MTTYAVVEHLDVLEDVGSRRVASLVTSTVHTLVLQTVEETLAWRIVPAVAFAAHRREHAVRGELFLKIVTAVLTAAIRVMNQPSRRPFSLLKTAEQWESREQDAVLDALNARVKLSAEIYGLRAMLNVHTPDLPAVVMGDFNDGPFADLMEAEFLIHNIVDELAGTMLYPRTYMQHAMEPDAFAEAATTSFPDPLRNGAITNELIDHILVSKAIWSDAVPFRVKPHSCIVEQAAFDHHDGEDALHRARGLRPGDPSAGVGGPRILGGSGKRPSVRMGELLRF